MPANFEVLQGLFSRKNLHINSIKSVTGGDINSCYTVNTTTGQYFIKINHAHRYPGMLQCEADGLIELQNATSLTLPGVVDCGVEGSNQYLLLSHLEKTVAGNDFFAQFGKGIAAVHQNSHEVFGWHTDNYIGLLPQQNTWQTNWFTFYANQRIMPLVQQLHQQKNYTIVDVTVAEKLCAKLETLFPAEAPALLHGDLWSGNYMPALLPNQRAAHPAIYDPAVYYGHREMDIGMSKLFGGFDTRFYQAYHHHFPLQPQWQQRLPLTQWYPLLVHAVLFGGHYIQQSKEAIKSFV